MNGSVGARLLVIGAGAHRESAFMAWQRAGLSVTLVDGFSHPRYDLMVDRYVAMDARDGVVLACPRDVDRLVDLAREHAGVVSLSDETLAVTSLVAERAGLPGPGAYAGSLARDKFAQRRSLQAAGVATPRAAQLDGPRALEAFLEESAGDVIVKPQDSGGSNCVQRLSCERFRGGELDVEAVWSLVSAGSESGRCVAEDFLTGEEISVEAMVVDGVVERCAVTRKELAGPAFFLERAHVSSTVDPLDVAALDEVSALVAAHGVRTGMLHVEYRVLDGVLTNIEFATRPGGDMIMDLVLRSRGWDVYADMARAAMGLPLTAVRPPVHECHAGVRFLLASGTVAGYATAATLLEGLESVTHVNAIAQGGRVLPPAVANWTRAGWAMGVGDDVDQLRAELRTAIGRLAESMGLTEIGSEAPSAEIGGGQSVRVPSNGTAARPRGHDDVAA